MQMARQFHCGVSRKITLQQHVNYVTHINIAHIGYSALKQHSEKKKHKGFSSTLQKVKDKEKVEEADKPKCTDSQKVLQDFFVKSSTSTSKATASSVETSDFAQDIGLSTSQTTVTEVVWTLPQLVAKVEIIATLQYASQNIPCSCADALQECYKQQFPDSAIAKHVSLGSKKMSYMVAYGLGPYFQQATVKEIIQGNSYFTLHFDETVSAQMKKHGLISVLLVREIKGNKSEVFSINNAWACQGRYSGT